MLIENCHPFATQLMTKMLESGVNHVVQNWHKKVCCMVVTHSLCHFIDQVTKWC